jgi:Zn finger protein HypA/HybF involved in hydrogenase expression
MPKKRTQEEFIILATLKHKGLYTYKNVIYVNNTTKVNIYCKKCKDYFLQIPKDHLNGRGCKYCGALKSINLRSFTKEIFIEKSKKYHLDIYDYSLVEYKNNRTNVKIICIIHGIFKQKPEHHMNGRGCPKCGNTKKLTLLEFIDKSNNIHNFKYNYSLVKYKNHKTKIEIICPKHNNFFQLAGNHVIGQGCPKCKSSRGELMLIKYFEKNNIKYETQKKYKFLDVLILYDFYIPSLNLHIEYDGEQHFKDCFFGKYNIQHLKDIHKNNFIAHKNYKLLRIHHKDKKNINNILNNNLNKSLKSNIYYSRKDYYKRELKLI